MPYKDPEKARARKRQLYLENRDARLSEEAQRYASDSEFRERKKAGARDYRARNLEKARERDRARRTGPEGDKRRAYDRARAASGENIARLRHRAHGLWPADIAAIYEAQEGCCYLCGEALAIDETVIDHDHDHCPKHRSCRVCRRGLAHSNCNVGIGYAGDSPATLRRMADALEAAQLAFTTRMAAAPRQLAFG